MSVRALLDVNMLLALFDEGHTHWGAAHAWWKEHQGDGWASCPLTENGFLRIISSSAYPRPLAFGDAASALRAQISDSDHLFWPDDVSLVDPLILDHGRVLGPNQITDLYLLALAVRNQGRLVTFDRSISLTAVRGAQSRHLVVL